VDNASGVGVLLELARVLAQEPHEESYLMVFFGAEEQGLVGSSYFAAQADLSAVNWMLNLDMVGMPMEIDVAGKKSTPPELTRLVTDLARKSRIHFHLNREAMVLNRDSGQGGNSDFSSFLDQGIPALGLGIAGRPAGFYHRPEDRLEMVNWDEVQKVGEFVDLLVREVRLNQSGPHTWDELYLTFQFGPLVFLLSGNLLRLIYLLVFIFVGSVLVRSLRQGLALRWQSYLLLVLVVFAGSMAAVFLSGLGELLWQTVKQRQFIWHAYPGLFLLARIVFIAGFFLYLGRWLPRLPVPREPRFYWISGVVMLFAAGLFSSLIRIDLAFPFVFWLACYGLQVFFPSLLFVLAGPYFFYRFHWEMLNSNQWLGYYTVFHRYYPLFVVLYAILIIPLLFGLLHVASQKPQRWQNILYKSRLSVLTAVVLTVLVLGLVPSYTSRYPQRLTVREEWVGETQNQLHLISPDKISKQLARELNVQPGKSLILPSFNQIPPVDVRAEVAEKAHTQKREIDLTVQFRFSRDPYLVSLTLESSKPFRVSSIDEFLPLSKLPRRVQLLGKRQNSGNYILVLERTPPQRNQIRLTLEGESTVKCKVQVSFPDPAQTFRINADNLSVDYQAFYEKEFEF